MKRLLHLAARRGHIDWLSYYFAEFIAARARCDIDDLLPVTAAILCAANREGDACIDLARHAGQPLFSGISVDDDDRPPAPALELWLDALAASPCVGRPGDEAPLILEGARLYLNRFWHYETAIAQRILAAIGEPADDGGGAASTATEADIDRDQQHAVRVAAALRFCVISGGPGSGKTSTVLRILELLLQRDPGSRIALTAPTGKAAARMLDSIRERAAQIGLGDDIMRALPAEASTLHRLLGYRREGFLYGADHPLPLDCVIVDEASMIDLKLMFHLLAALPREGRLILLGDRDQLASVAAGNVLGDITGHGCDLDASDNPLARSISLLRGNYRFGHDSAIGSLAQAVNGGDAVRVVELLEQGEHGLAWYRDRPAMLDPAALEWICAAYGPVFDSASPADALAVYARTRVLCATNQGPTGVDALNAEISRVLLERNGLTANELYPGLPIMLTRNDHELGLYNGDTGILWRFPQGLRACFTDGRGGVRDLAVNRLREFVPAWASTVHKSQGSEFDSVLLTLPADPESEALSRELLYTAVTRARREFVLHAGSDVVGAAVARLTRRFSGLAHKLGWPPTDAEARLN